MKKQSVGQQNAQKQLHVFPDARKKKYQGKPKSVRQGKSETEKLQIVEENDYAGVRSHPPEDLVTEKSTDAKRSRHDENRKQTAD